jgi:hypothetical protein
MQLEHLFDIEWRYELLHEVEASVARAGARTGRAAASSQVGRQGSRRGPTFPGCILDTPNQMPEGRSSWTTVGSKERLAPMMRYYRCTVDYRPPIPAAAEPAR